MQAVSAGGKEKSHSLPWGKCVGTLAWVIIVPFFHDTEFVSLGHPTWRWLWGGWKDFSLPSPEKCSLFSGGSIKMKIMAKTWNTVVKFLWWVQIILLLWMEISCVLQNYTSSAFSVQCPMGIVSLRLRAFPLLLKTWVFLLRWKTFHTINTNIIDCYVARMTQRLKAAEIQFFESIFHSYKPNTFNFVSHEMAPEQQAQTQEQHGTFPCKSQKDAIWTTAGAKHGNIPSNPGFSFRLH